MILAGPHTGRANIAGRDHHCRSSFLHSTHSAGYAMVANLWPMTRDPSEKILYLAIFHTEEGRFWVESWCGGLGVQRAQRHAEIVDSSSSVILRSPSCYLTCCDKKNFRVLLREAHFANTFVWLILHPGKRGEGGIKL